MGGRLLRVRDSGAAKPLPAEHPDAHIRRRRCVSQRAGRPIPCNALRIKVLDPPAEGSKAVLSGRRPILLGILAPERLG